MEFADRLAIVLVLGGALGAHLWLRNMQRRDDAAERAQLQTAMARARAADLHYGAALAYAREPSTARAEECTRARAVYDESKKKQWE